VPRYLSFLTIERKLTAHEKPLIIFQQLQKEGRNPLFMLRYAGKPRAEGERDREDRDKNGSARTVSGEDPTTPKSATPIASDGHGRFG